MTNNVEKTFTTSYLVEYNTTNSLPQYYEICGKVVVVDINGYLNATIDKYQTITLVTLPVGYRPKHQINVSTTVDNNASALNLRINTDGAVQIRNCSSNSFSSSGIVRVSGNATYITV